MPEQEKGKIKQKNKKTASEISEAVFVWACALVPLTHPFSNSFMRDLDAIWEMIRVIPAP